jgi:hypothetical protein
MELRDSYIRLYRSLIDHPLMNQVPAAWFRIWIAILLGVNWKAGKWWDGSKEVIIPAGSMVTSVDKLAKKSKSTVRQTRNALEYLKTTNTLAIKTTSHYSIVTVVNWDSYQKAPESEGKPNAAENDKPQTNQGQGADKPGPTIKEGNKENREQSKNTPIDSSLASQNGAKTSEYTFDLAQTSHPKPKHTQQDRTNLGLAMARYLDPIGRTRDSVLPPGSDVDGVLAKLGNRTVKDFCKHLGTLPAVYRPGGKHAPRTWKWFIGVAESFANAEPLQVPTAERCRHNKEWGVCCNHPAVDNAMTNAFDGAA